MNQVVFAYLHLLWLLVPITVLLFWSIRHIHGMMKVRKWISTFIRWSVACLIVLALAGPEARRPNRGTCTLFLLDRSDSISEEDRANQLKFVNESIKSLQNDDQAGVIVFGVDAQVEVLPGKITAINRILSQTDGAGSDVAAAVRLAAAVFPEGMGRRIVVLSDGNETTGDVTEAAEVVASEGMVVDYVPQGVQKTTGEVTLVETELPSEIRVGQKFPIKVIVDSSTSGSAILNLDADGATRQTMPVNLVPGKNTFVFTEEVERPGFRRYRVEIQSAQDKDARNNVGVGFVAARDKNRVLILQEDPTKTELALALRNQDLEVDLLGKSGVPFRTDQVLKYDAILLNDFNAVNMTPGQMKILQAAVRDSGIGMAMIGGENSFLPGGYYGTPVAEALPVDLNVRQRKTFPSTSILIIADTSGSMSMIEDGVPKVRLAAKAAEETVRVLSPNDRVGVAGSTDAIQFVAPMQKLTDKENVISQVRRLSVGGGGIYCYPSMEFAEKHLMAETTRVRHLILLGDGNDCDLQEGCLLVAARMKSNKITTSTVSIGKGPHSPFLQTLAAAGGGNYYLAERANQLPAIFTQDAAIMSRSAIEEGTFLPKVGFGEDALRGINSDSIPALFGYCLTDTKPLSRVGMRTQKDDPLLATWQYGLGQSLAFTSDAQSRWARVWVGWDGFGKFWGQAVRGISRRLSQTRYDIKTKLEGSRAVVSIRGTDESGNPVNIPPKEVRVSLPEGESRELQVSQVGPGEFQGVIPAKELGSYIITVAEEANGGTRVSSSGFSLPYPMEYRTYRTNNALLERMSEVGGGTLIKSPDQAVRSIDKPGFSVRELWQTLLFIAMLMLPVDFAVRRLALPMSAIWATIRGFFRRSERTVEVPAHVERLKGAKARVPKADSETVKGPIIKDSGTQYKSAQGGSTSAASKLLESRKNRNREEE